MNKNMDLVSGVTIGDFFDSQADNMPHQKALITPGQSDYTFGELKTISDILARGMMDLGISKGDKAGLWANNIPEWIFIFLALGKIGAIVVPIHTSVKTSELHYTLKQADIKFLFMVNNVNGTDLMKTIHLTIPDLRIHSSGKVQSKEFPFLRRIISIEDNNATRFLRLSEIKNRTRQIDKSDFQSLRKTVCDMDSILIKFTCALDGYSGGATLTHFGLINNARSMAKRLKFDSSDIICMPIPLFYIFGFWVGFMVSVTTHASMVIMPQYSALEVLKTIEEKHCTALYGVPSMFYDFLKHPKTSGLDCTSIRTGVLGGDYCPPGLIERIIKEMPVSYISNLYGITEVGILSQTECNDQSRKWIHTVGKPLDGMEMKVVNSGNGKTVLSGQIGEICVRSPVIMKHYYKMPRKTREIIDQDMWFHTGDLGKFDKNGYYQITGRKRNLIIRGGENIYPMEIEKHLLAHPDILDARVVGVPSTRLSEEVYAFVKKRKSSTKCNHKTIKEYLGNKIARFKVPRWIDIVEAIPGEKRGNVDRNNLRTSAIQKLKLKNNPSFKIIYDN